MPRLKYFNTTTNEWEYVGTGGGGGTAVAQSDWNAAEGDPGHVLNRTHWTEDDRVELLPETTLTTDDEGFADIAADFTLIVGDVYTVVYNGTAYQCTCVESDGSRILANDGINEDTGEGLIFGIVQSAGVTFILSMTPGEVTFSIYHGGEIVHKLNNKYLDLDWLPVLEYDDIIPKTTVTQSMSIPGTAGIYNKLEVGQTLILIVDGVEYKTTVTRDLDGKYLEDYGTIRDPSNAQPHTLINGLWGFMVVSSYDEARFWGVEPGTHTIRLVSAAGNKNRIPESFIPDGYAKQEDIPTDDHIIELIQEHAPDSGGNADQFIETTYTQFETFAIDTSGETVDTTALVGNENWFHFVKKCKAGSTVYVTCDAGEYYRAWALIDDDGRVLQVAEANAKPRNYPIDIAEDCTLVVNLMKVSSFQNSVTIKEPVGSAKYNPVVKTEDMTHPVGVDDEGRLWVAPIGDSSDGENVEYETTTYTKAEYNKMAINTSGETADLTALVGDQSWSHLAVWCEAGTKVYVTGKGGVSYRTWALVAEDGSVLSASAASEVCENTELTIESACYVVVNAAYGFNTSLTVVIPKKAESAMDIALENRDIINAIQDTLSGRVPFGIGIDCKYTAPDIDAMSIPAVGNRLTYFYGLYDGLLANHSDYISKVDCDAVAVAAGIERPEYMADYPIYLYKFVPAYTSKTNAMDGVTAQRSKIKVFITTGTHPENMAIWDMYNVMRLVCENWETDDNLEALRWDCEIYVMPCSGSYSVENGSRTNYNGVDLNRNAPTANWTLTTEGTNTYSGPSAGSEYETKVFTHFMELLAPDVYIDHHNTDPTGDPGIAIYGTAQHQKEIDILSEHISVMSRRWKKRFQDVFPQDNTSIFGWAGPWGGTGSREGYGAEHVSRSFTYESQWTLLWDNGELVDGAHRGDTVACTCATDGFINFLLRMLKTTW